ncbi:VOC family protein [uncultured Aliiroseovarius sp.]|uniref:VOC family protein n=1 Tax=uncultured Aliiroseovarius sp. TaxID=1658783 RepID=UPI00260BC89D|nr:VOC family protein [uncultured Aliiroseovarius sp.]
MTPRLNSLDHFVLTVASINRTVSFYADVLGMTAIQFKVADGSARWALEFGQQKINLHQAGREFDPKAATPTPGSADLCFLSDTPLEAWMTHLKTQNVAIVEGPVPRTGAQFPIQSIYIRDPDGNLIEIAERLQD